MKILILAVATAALLGWGVIPAFHQEVVSAKRASPERNRLLRERDLRMGRALAALKAGDASRQAEVRAALADLEPNDRHRPAFAAALAARGEIQTAYGLMRTRVHFSEYGLPYDGELAFYAGLATRAGHPEEAVWARERTGMDGHFRVWTRGERNYFSRGASRWIMGPGVYRDDVNRSMDEGLRLYPAHREEIESLRRELLAAP